MKYVYLFSLLVLVFFVSINTKTDIISNSNASPNYNSSASTVTQVPITILLLDEEIERVIHEDSGLVIQTPKNWKANVEESVISYDSPETVAALSAPNSGVYFPPEIIARYLSKPEVQTFEVFLAAKSEGWLGTYANQTFTTISGFPAFQYDEIGVDSPISPAAVVFVEINSTTILQLVATQEAGTFTRSTTTQRTFNQILNSLTVEG